MRFVVVVLLAACTTSPPAETNHCPAPPEPTFSCEPIASGSVGCIGSCRHGCDVAEDVPTSIDDATFPVGCTETLTVCTPYYSGEPAECDCDVVGSNAPEWITGC